MEECHSTMFQCLPVVFFQSIKLFVFNVSNNFHFIRSVPSMVAGQFVGIKYQTMMINLCIALIMLISIPLLAFASLS